MDTRFRRYFKIADTHQMSGENIRRILGRTNYYKLSPRNDFWVLSTPKYFKINEVVAFLNELRIYDIYTYSFNKWEKVANIKQKIRVEKKVTKVQKIKVEEKEQKSYVFGNSGFAKVFSLTADQIRLLDFLYNKNILRSDFYYTPIEEISKI